MTDLTKIGLELTIALSLIGILKVLWELGKKAAKNQTTLEEIPIQLTSIVGKVDAMDTRVVGIERSVGTISTDLTDHKEKTKTGFVSLEGGQREARERLATVEKSVSTVETEVKIIRAVDDERKRTASKRAT